jgi:hypothetical protein
VEFIALKTQLAELRPSVDRRIAAVLAHGQFIMGPEVAELEAALAEFVCVRHCVTLSSGTDALLAALMALGIGPGHEVITTAFTYAATSTPGGVVAHVKRQAARGLADLVIVDYLQLLSGSGKKGENRVQELTEITTGLKALAKELSVPIVALSQLSRQVESRDDKRPQLSDLRESGSIEQDADVVMFVYRDEYYLQNREPKPGTQEHMDWQVQMDQAHGKAEVIIGKQRHGPTGTVQLAFQANITRFTDLADEDKLPERMGD